MGLYNSVQFLCSYSAAAAELEVRAGGNDGKQLFSQRCTFFIVPRGADAYIGLKGKIEKEGMVYLGCLKHGSCEWGYY